MLKGWIASSILQAGMLLALPAAGSAQTPQTPAPRPQNTTPSVDGWTGKVVPSLAAAQAQTPAPRRDIFGIWTPGSAGIQPMGAEAMPEDGKPEHELPYTSLGLEKLKLTKPTNGVRSVLPARTNDPAIACDPQGMPREDLFELRTTQIIQRRSSVVLLYEFDRVWRVAWTDGRQASTDAEPRWFGYSVGTWEDDYTFVIQTTGISEETWVDRAGRPHSNELLVEERFHRANYGTLELTVIIHDPKMYTKPWVALDRLPFRLLPEDYDVMEMMCSPSQIGKYNEFVGEPASLPEAGGK